MADNNYTISSNFNAANDKSVAAYSTGTYLCSALLAFSPVTGLSSFHISAINLYGNTANLTISSDRSFPATIVNGVNSSIYCNVVYANNNPLDTATFSQLICAGVTAGNASLSAGATGTILANGISYTTAFTVSALNGWRAGPGGRVWDTHQQHMKYRNMGYI